MTSRMVGGMPTAAVPLVWLAVSFAATFAEAADEPAEGRDAKPAVRVTVELLDGSRIVGRPEATAVPLALEFAKVDVPLHLLAGCEFRHKDRVAVVTFANGDRLTGRVGLEELPLESSVGRIAPKLEQVSRFSVSTLHAGPMPPGNAGTPFGGVRWLTWRTGFEVRGGRFVSLPSARAGFRYGHDGHGRGAILATNVGSRDWRDYRIAVRFCMPGVDPAFDPYGLGPEFCGGMICFHVADAKESHNDRGLTAYCLGIDGDGAWRLESVVNAFCDQPAGFGNPREDSRRRLAAGTGLRIDRARGNRYAIEVSGNRIVVAVDDEEIADLVDDRMGEAIGEQKLDHGGVAFVGGFDSMIWIEEFSAVPL